MDDFQKEIEIIASPAISMPLVSIVVFTYNSSNYVLETLESCKVQTYDNIELIISDDASTDNTVEVCREWLVSNKNRFVSTDLITVEVNSGIPANCNRGVKGSKGEWVKLIAGDDALTKTAIEDVINFLNTNHSIEVLATQVEKFKDSFENSNSLGIKPNYLKRYLIYSKETSIKLQFEFLLKGGYHLAPGFFVKQDIFQRIGYFDEKYSLLEDVPFYLNLGWNQILIYFAPIVTVYYREHNLNMTNQYSRTLQRYVFQHQAAVLESSLKYGKIRFIVNSYWNLGFYKLIMALGNKGKTCYRIDQFRRKFQPIRIYGLFDRFIFS